MENIYSAETFVKANISTSFKYLLYLLPFKNIWPFILPYILSLIIFTASNANLFSCLVILSGPTWQKTYLTGVAPWYNWLNYLNLAAISFYPQFWIPSFEIICVNITYVAYVRKLTTLSGNFPHLHQSLFVHWHINVGPPFSRYIKSSNSRSWIFPPWYYGCYICIFFPINTWYFFFFYDIFVSVYFFSITCCYFNITIVCNYIIFTISKVFYFIRDLSFNVLVLFILLIIYFFMYFNLFFTWAFRIIIKVILFVSGTATISKIWFFLLKFC